MIKELSKNNLKSRENLAYYLSSKRVKEDRLRKNLRKPLR